MLSYLRVGDMSFEFLKSESSRVELAGVEQAAAHRRRCPRHRDVRDFILNFFAPRKALSCISKIFFNICVSCKQNMTSLHHRQTLPPEIR